jgi:hypothetical protein
MAAVSHPDPDATAYHGAPARQAAISARRAALFASGLQRSDATTAAMAAEAITDTVRRFGIHGCISRMAQEFGDHPDAAARTAEPEMSLKPGAATTAQRPDSGRGPSATPQRRQDAA